MKYAYFALITIFLPLVSVSPLSAHMYDAIGVEADPHSHDDENTRSTKKNNCFIDPKFGPICK